MNTTSALFRPSIITLASLKTARRNTAPPVASHNTQQGLQLSVQGHQEHTNFQSLHVRWPGKACGAMAFALIFLFLFPSREKERKVQKESKQTNFYV
jgi:hypothetical protein